MCRARSRRDLKSQPWSGISRGQSIGTLHCLPKSGDVLSHFSPDPHPRRECVKLDSQEIPPTQRLCEKASESPNRKVGDAFTSAYWKRGSGSPQSPNRKVGDLSSRCASRCSGLAVKEPQPPGWGICKIALAGLLGWTEASPTFRLGDSLAFSHSLAVGGLFKPGLQRGEPDTFRIFASSRFNSRTASRPRGAALVGLAV
jgi:hypothetical protein